MSNLNLARLQAARFSGLISDLGSSVKLWWKLDDALGSSTVADSSGNGNTGTVTGTWGFRVPLGELMGAASAGAQTSYILNAAPASMPAAPHTLFYVFSYDGVTVNTNLVGHDTSYLAIRVSSLVGVDLMQAGASVTTGGSNLFRPGDVHTVALVVDGLSNATVYVDDIERISSTAVTPGSWSGGIRIGSGAANNVRGAFSHLIVANAALTASQIANLSAAVPR